MVPTKCRITLYSIFCRAGPRKAGHVLRWNDTHSDRGSPRVAGLSAAQGPQTFTGTITDDMCAKAGHAQMRMGPTDADCVKACIVSHGAMYVLLDGKDVYILSDQQTPEKFAAQKVDGRRHAGRQDEDDPRAVDRRREIT